MQIENPSISNFIACFFFYNRKCNKASKDDKKYPRQRNVVGKLLIHGFQSQFYRSDHQMHNLLILNGNGCQFTARLSNCLDHTGISIEGSLPPINNISQYTQKTLSNILEHHSNVFQDHDHSMHNSFTLTSSRDFPHPMWRKFQHLSNHKLGIKKCIQKSVDTQVSE